MKARKEQSLKIESLLENVVLIETVQIQEHVDQVVCTLKCPTMLSFIDTPT